MSKPSWTKGDIKVVNAEVIGLSRGQQSLEEMTLSDDDADVLFEIVSSGKARPTIRARECYRERRNPRAK